MPQGVVRDDGSLIKAHAVKSVFGPPALGRGLLLPEKSWEHLLQSRLIDNSLLPTWLVLQKFSCSMRLMKPTTLLGTLILLSAWSSVGATEAGTYSIPKAVNSVEERIAAARSDESWSQLLKPKPHKSLEFAAWGNGR